MNTVSSPTFPSMNAASEAASVFVGTEFCGDKEFSLQFITSLMTNSAGATYEVMGSNISTNQADMVDVLDESGAAGVRGVTTPFVRKDFPYKFIGINYITGGGTGTYTVCFEQKLKVVTLVG